MEPTIAAQPASPASVAPAAIPAICPTCHQPTLPQYYFCPNCGTKLNTPPLSTSVWMQTGIYAFSIILPVMCYLAITKWPGIKYIRSHDEKTKQIGIIALTLLIVSTIVTVWYTTVWVNQQIQSSLNAVNADMSGE